MFDFIMQMLPQNIDKLEKNNNVGALINILKNHKDRSLREKAAYALGRLRDESCRAKATEALTTFISDKNEDEQIRSVCTVALSYNTTPKNEQLLLALLKDPDESEGIQSAVLQALSDFKTPDSIIAIIESLNALSPKVQTVAGDALGLNTTSANNLRAAIFSDNGSTRLKAAKDLSIGEYRKVLEILLTAINSTDDKLRNNIIQALGCFDSPALIDPLLARLDKEKGANLVSLYSTLGKIKNEKTIDALLDGLKKDSPTIKTVCINALCEKRSEKAVEKLLTIFQNEGEYPEQRVNLAKALGKTKSTKAMEALLKALPTATEPLRARIEDSLVEMEHPDLDSNVNILLESKNSSARFSAVRIIGKQKKHGSAPILMKMLEDPNPDVRNAAINALGDYREAGVSERLIAILTNQDIAPQLRATAALSLGKLGEEKALQPLFESVNDNNEIVRVGTAKALGSYRKQEVIDTLGALATQDPSENVRCNALLSLGAIRDLKVVEYIKKAEMDPVSMKVRNTATAILNKTINRK